VLVTFSLSFLLGFATLRHFSYFSLFTNTHTHRTQQVASVSATHIEAPFFKDLILVFMRRCGSVGRQNEMIPRLQVSIGKAARRRVEGAAASEQYFI